MKRVLGFLKEYRLQAILSPLFKLLEASLELLVPLLVARMIDVGIAGRDTHFIVLQCVYMAALGLAGLAFSITAQYFAAGAAAGVTTRLRHGLLEHIQELSYSNMDTIGNDTLLTRITSDVNLVQNGVNMTLRLLLRSPFVVIGAMVMAFTVDGTAAVWFAIVIPILFAVVFAIMLITIPLYKKVQQRVDRVLCLTRENLTGVRVLRAFCLEEEEVAHFQSETSSLAEAQNFVGKLSALLNPLTFGLVNAAVICLIWTGAIQVDSGLLTQGAVIALYNYMAQILAELIKTANLTITITKAVASSKRISSILDAEPDQKWPTTMDTLPAPGTGIVFSHVSLTYKNAGAPSLQELSFTVAPGTTVGIIGGTGSGKTSLINLIPRFYDATAGSIFLDGRNINEYTKEALRNRIGIVPQNAVLFQGTIRDNLLWGNEDATDEALNQAIAEAQASDIVAGKENGLDEVIEQNGRNLSGGQRQRLTIARALVRKPDILIFDDSSSALDYATDASLRAAIRALPYAPTVFIVSQRTASLEYADQILVLEEGKLVGRGNHAELLQSCSVYQEIYYSQFDREVQGNE